MSSEFDEKWDVHRAADGTVTLVGPKPSDDELQALIDYTWQRHDATAIVFNTPDEWAARQ